MKRAWSVISFLAVVHLLALAMFVGWLWQSNRLDRDRLNLIRQTFAMTIAESQEAQRRAEQEAEAAYEAALAEGRRQNPPVPSHVRLSQISQIEEIEHRAVRRLEQERAMLREQIATAQNRLDAREERLNQKSAAWLASVEEERQRRTDEQFAKTVRQYESVRPKQGKDMLMELIAIGQMKQAVAYLDAMNARASSRILGEFKTDAEVRLATELLEQLRTFGVPDVDLQDSPELPDARNVADAR